MKIIVCLKQVPDTEASIKIGADQTSIAEESIKFVMNPYDEFAVEEAIKMKEAGKAESITAISIGPDRAKEALKSALAMGVDEALLLKTDNKGIDSLAVAKALSQKIKEIGFDFILMGKEAIDDGNSQTGPMLAELLDIPCITTVTKLDVSDKVVAEREVEGGVQVLETSLPCIITCQKGLNEPRYPSIRGVMMAKKKQIPEENIESGDSVVNVISFTYPPARSGGKLVGEGVDAVPELVRLLREEAKVI